MHRPTRSRIWPATGSALKMGPAFDGFVANKRSETDVGEREIEKTVVGSREFPRIWSSIGCATELVAGIFVVLYLLAALALSATVLLYTFTQ